MDEYPAAGKEPAFNAPWPAVVLVAALLAAYGVQRLLGADQLAQTYGFVPTDLASGQFLTLISSQFLHGGWLHVGMNAVWALALAPPVSRYLGARAGGAAALWLLFLICGAIGCLGFAVMHWGEAGVVLVGASGGVAGLMGAASRLLGRRQGLAPLNDRRVLALGGSWVAINLLLAVLGGTALLEGTVVGWEAHLAGYAAGLVLLSPAARLADRADRWTARLRP